MKNIYKKILEETAFCASHLKSGVKRNQETQKWSFKCNRGWYLSKLPVGFVKKALMPNEKAICEIIIEEAGGLHE